MLCVELTSSFITADCRSLARSYFALFEYIRSIAVVTPSLSFHRRHSGR